MHVSKETIKSAFMEDTVNQMMENNFQIKIFEVLEKVQFFQSKLFLSNLIYIFRLVRFLYQGGCNAIWHAAVSYKSVS